MKKKIWIPIVCVVVVVLAVLFVPFRKYVMNDGGSEEYIALTYKVIKWNRYLGNGNEPYIYRNTVVYFGSDKNKSADELWRRESKKIKYSVIEAKNTNEWLDKETAQKSEIPIKLDLIITDIYSDCFFASSPYDRYRGVKVNSSLPDEWCVGDSVFVTCDECYVDKYNRMECDLNSIYLGPGEMFLGKPVIYLYPEQNTEVSVKLLLDGTLTCTYPSYEKGWNVTASPDGTLTDKNGKTYNYLYWEGEAQVEWDMSRGFCVKGEDTAVFLEDALAKLGLNRREANEFIVYWLPLMQENEYNIITFQTDAYTDTATLDITPKPDTLIRVFMAYMPTDDHIEIEEQELTSPERVGFTVIEWGGTEIGK